jgi:hypothetical protein
MPDDATLRDATTQEDPANPQATTPQEGADKAKAAPASEPPAATAPDAADKDAAELGKLLIESGYNREKINDLLAAPNALQSIQYLVRNNPQEFLTMLERTDPDAARKFHETMADEYVKRYQKTDTPGAKNGAADSELMAEVQALREKVNQSETREQQREQAKAMAATQARYNQNVDKLFDNEDIKKMALTPAEKKNMRARLDSELARDPAAVQRLNNGNFFDVPRRFKDIIEELGNDKKAASEAAKSQRQRASDASAFDFANGPNQFTVDPKTFADDWDKTEEAFAAGLEKFAQ